METPVPIPRLLAIMGSGETSPTMVKTHRELLARLGPPPVPAVVLDTPYGFQANAADLASRAVEYFRESVGQPIEVAHLLAADGDPLEYETMLAKLRAARYVFAGPGSPTYALRQWQATLVPKMLTEKLQSGGCLTFASAAALTLGVATVPVYEIYKAGEEPRWLDGLDLLGEIGIRAAVIPHYNNAEGGTHDTRFCYLGETRLALMEQDLPDGAFVLGVDEHTGLVLDIDAGTASVVGLGAVTVRRGGASTEVPTGTTMRLAELLALAAAPGGAAGVPRGSDVTGPTGSTLPPPQGTGASPLLQNVAQLEAAFAAAVDARDVDEAVRSVLALEEELVSWSRDTLQSDELDRGRAALRGMVVRLGELAVVGARDPVAAVRPFVDALLAQREAARSARRWADADAVRDGLVELGVEVQDAPEGTTWRLVS
ncbi:MAG: CysS/YqeB C-terminal domain-containing protein [Acidimicrobiales bacterium]